MELTSGSRVAIVGGGPAGAFTAYFLLDLAQKVGLDLSVDIYEPKPFYLTGPGGCNLCGGVISESLVQLLATEGIHLPSEVIIDTIDAYTLHTPGESARIHATVDEHRIASIYRGGGPRGSESQNPLPWDSFDWFLLRLAVGLGARHIPLRVKNLDWDGGKPRVHTESSLPQTYDLLVGALGLNAPALKLFTQLGFGYQPPRSARAWIGELYYGQEQVEKMLGNAMHIFLLDTPGLQFAALTPKGHYATLIVLGKQVNQALVQQVLQDPELRALFPPGWEIPVLPCDCQPRIQIGDPRNPFGDRVVMVGDCSVSRLYKDGIGAAYRTAKACALTAITHGVSKEAFRRYYAPTCATLSWDNRIGHLLFGLDGAFKRFPFFRRALISVVRWEQQQPPPPFPAPPPPPF
ncbi:MAG: hypothetical protein HQL51_05230, partial [Magnetococcales bacterium]|nr:hypothetical protein [Magnetococcales bacterium]